MPITHSLWTVTQEHPTIVAIAGDGWSPHPRAPDRNLGALSRLLVLLGQRRGQRSTLFYLGLP
jgi:hypothetical protein